MVDPHRGPDGRFLPGNNANPKGNPDSLRAENRKGHKVPYESKLKSLIKRDILRHGRYSRKLKHRSCDECPLRPRELRDGTIIQKCRSYEAGKKDCPVDMEDWIWQIKTHFMAEELGTRDVLKYNAVLNTMRAARAEQYETLTRGRAGDDTHKFAKLAADAAAVLHRVDADLQKSREVQKVQVESQSRVTHEVITPDELFGPKTKKLYKSDVIDVEVLEDE